MRNVLFLVLLMSCNTGNYFENVIRRLIFEYFVKVFFPRGIEILGWCPAGSVLPHGEKVPLALVGYPCSDGVAIKIPSGVDVLLFRPPSHPIFSYWVVKTKSDFIVRSVETDLRR